MTSCKTMAFYVYILRDNLEKSIKDFGIITFTYFKLIMQEHYLKITETKNNVIYFVNNCILLNIKKLF